MFYEISITPSVFKFASYGSRELCDAELRGIWTDLNGSLVVRDLRAGEWHRSLWQNKTESSFFAQKILKALRDDKRLRRASPVLLQEPADSVAWCREALASHGRDELSGVMTCPSLKQHFRDEDIVCAIDQRHRSGSWWSSLVVGGPTRIRRTTAGYQQALSVLLRGANHLVFMDPHLDPERNDYREFKNLLVMASRSDGVQPVIEIHRVCYEGLQDRRRVDDAEWERRFRKLRPDLQRAGLEAEVFIWPEEHDRHILSDLGGVHMGNGFTINNNPKSFSTWTRLPRNTADAVRREFDPSVNRPHHRFKIVGC